MKNSTLSFCTLLLCCSLSLFAAGKPPAREYYQIRIYHVKTEAQVQRVDSFLRTAYLPALHRAGIREVGVFKPVTQDTADLKIYVLIPFRSLEHFEKLPATLEKDAAYQQAGSSYINAAHNNTAYTRLESILLRAFIGMPVHATPGLTGPKSERVYELRSYESPSEKYHINKVKMFNDGDEVGIFRRLGFNAVFYAEVLSGSRMPNLMYMTTFRDQADRDARWKSFSADPDWKKLSAMEEYKNNVSKADKFFLRPVEYSDL